MPDVYFDHNATSPLASEVREAMEPYLRGTHGNPSCGHRHGQQARAVIEDVRRQMSEYFGCGRDEVIFTSGGTEANNLALKGAAFARRELGTHIVIGASEHPSVVEPARFLADNGFEVTEAKVDETGQVTQDALEEALRPDTILVSVMNAQNVVGTINRIDALAEVIRGRRILFHTDAAQSVGKIPTAFPFLGVDLMTIAAHKFYGPKGVGALIARRGLELVPVLHGAGHEGGRRPGTENTCGIVGLGAAVALARSGMAEAGERVVALRDGLHLRLAEALPGVVLNGHPLDRLPNTLNLSFLGVSGKGIAERLPTLMVSTGPACRDRSEADDTVPPTFRAMGLGVERSSSSLRLSLGRSNTWDEVEQVADAITEVVRTLRGGVSLPAGADQPSGRPSCPRCEIHPLRLELASIAPSVVCERHPTCRYQVWLAAPAGSQ